MEYKHCCVIDAQGLYVDYVLVLLIPQETGEVREEIQYYQLGPGENLADIGAPSETLVKPRYNGTGWEESAMPEEIEEWEREHPAPPPAGPSELELLRQQVAALQAQIDSLTGAHA